MDYDVSGGNEEDDAGALGRRFRLRICQCWLYSLDLGWK